MTYLAICTFDLKDASSTDYKNAYADLDGIGLSKVQTGSKGSSVVIPTTTVMGEFKGQSAAGVRDYVLDSVKKAFLARGFDSEIFVIVGDDWAWGSRTT